MPAHRFHLGPDTPLAPGPLVIGGDEAHHAARVKRLETGQPVEILDGRGGVASARVSSISKSGKGQWELTLAVESVRRADPIHPSLEVWSAVPKGPRAEDLVESLSQIGAARWRPLLSERSVVDPRQGKLSRFERVASEAAKQCGREWTLEIGPALTFAEAIASGMAKGRSMVLADGSGDPYQPSGAGRIILLVGPEGGWSPEESQDARRFGATVARFGPHIMRIETATAAAAAIILDAERRPQTHIIPPLRGDAL